MPLVLRARLSSPCLPEKAMEAELSRMSRMCRGCQKRIRDRLTLYKITINIFMSRMSRMFWGLCTPGGEGVSRAGWRRHIYLLSIPPLGDVFIRDIRDNANYPLYFRWLVCRGCKKRIRAASATGGIRSATRAGRATSSLPRTGRS
jgi:hypothetical protein